MPRKIRTTPGVRASARNGGLRACGREILNRAFGGGFAERAFFELEE